MGQRNKTKHENEETPDTIGDGQHHHVQIHTLEKINRSVYTGIVWGKKSSVNIQTLWLLKLNCFTLDITLWLHKVLRKILIPLSRINYSMPHVTVSSTAQGTVPEASLKSSGKTNKVFEHQS